MIALVTDSTSYLTAQEARDLGVKLIPLSYSVDGLLYSETFVESNGDFEGLIARSNGACHVTTSQITLPMFMALFEELTQQGMEVLCLTISSRLSGTYSNASLAAKSVGGAIRIVDGRTTAGGSCLLLRHAAQRIREGAQLQPLAEELRALREQIGIAFSVTDMNPLRRSGRLGIVRQSVGTILNIRPILQLVQGGVVACDTARGRRDQIRKLAGCVPKDAQRLIVHAIGNQHGADDLAAQLEQLFPGVTLERRRVGPVLGIHLGLDVIGVVWDRSPQAASLSF